MSAAGSLGRLLTGTAEVLHDVNVDDLPADDLEALGQGLDTVGYELVGLGSRLREACRRSVNDTPVPHPVKPINPPPQDPPPPPKDSQDTYSEMCETLDGYANRALAEGTLRAFETLTGSILVGCFDDEGDPVYYGEIEGYPEDVTRSFTGERVDGVEDVLKLESRRGIAGGRVEFAWLAWAEKVPAVVDRIRIPDGLRARIGAAADIADAMAEEASVLGWFTREIDGEILEMANRHTHAGQDNGPLLDLLLDTLTGPLGQRIKLICGRMDDAIGQVVGTGGELLDLDGQPRRGGTS